MPRFFKNRDVKKGKSPDTLVFLGNKKMEYPRIRVIDFDPDYIKEEELNNIQDGVDYINTNTVTWINIDGLHDLDLVQQVGSAFDLHPLLLEDLVNTAQRPKIEEFDNCLFMTLKIMHYDQDKNIVSSDQFSMIVGATYLLTFQERPGNWFEPVRRRIRKLKTRVRTSGTDYLTFALIRSIIDQYNSIIGKIGERIEDLEEEILSNPDNSIMEEINTYKKEMNYLRKSIRPAREAIFDLLNTESELIQETTVPFIRDLLDLTNQASEAIDTYRDLLTDQLNIYNSVISNRMNDIMKVLTIYAAIFIPLTFIAGVYGTNFKYLPELEFKYSYYIFWGVLITVAIFMLNYFKRKKWL